MSCDEDDIGTGPPKHVGMALGISSQEWSQLGLGDDPSVAAADDLELTVERLTALLLIRIVAWIQPRGTFTDLSATTICRQVLVKNSCWPKLITNEVVAQLRNYVKNILSAYQAVPYHNFEHCYHVTISVNKMMEMILHPLPDETLPPTFGFRDDPLMQFALLFSALIHDVEHQGIPNRQLANEDDVLAIQYNDTSIAEHKSLFIGFNELLKPDYFLLRKAVFPEKEDYRRFRAAVINLVLTTDIASPERSQIGKSKWKEAFGDPYETVERKVMQYMERKASLSSRASSLSSRASPRASSRVNQPLGRAGRRMSTQSIMSELSLESPVNINEGDMEDDTSISVTPDNSDEEVEDNADSNAAQAPTKKLPSNDETLPLNDGPVFRPPARSKSNDMDYSSGSPGTRGKSNFSRRSDPLGTSSDHGTNLSGMALKFHRRLSSIGSGNGGRASKRYRNTRLGLLRTVDLSGETIQTYKTATPRTSATGAFTGDDSFSNLKLAPAEEVEELPETVVMETIMKAADVAHNLQGWDHMAKWSNRLFLELRSAHVQGRGDDPTNGWFTNQIGFLEAYLLPLARKLDDTGVFGDSQGGMFASIVENNKDQWTREGMALTADIVREGYERFPGENSDSEA